ncbi:MAG: peptidase M14 [Gemmatimonadetes bacterium]|nr:peptidase M14 [Gemmatimonadota bacterium]
MTRPFLVAAIIGTTACSGTRGAGPPPLPPPPPPLPSPTGPSADLITIYDAVRVPGLEDRRFNHATYWGAVTPYLGGSITTVTEGTSAEGREIRHLSFGSGETTVLLWSQMHGNESTASMALADIIRFFHDRPDHPLARRIARGATIHMIPMLNPDGAERFRRRNAQGIDVNRDARRLQTPEGKFLKAARDAIEPEFGFNLHDQSAAVRVGRSDRIVAIALLAPAYNEARDVDAKRRRAMQVASVLVEAMDPLVGGGRGGGGGGHIAKYDDTFTPRTFGDLMAAWGSSTILIESGGWRDDPQKQHLRKTNFVGILSALDAIATGRYADYDPAVYDNLEFNGRSVPDLLVAGGTIAVPGAPTLAADILIRYDRPLLREGGRIVDIGDLGKTQAQDTMRVDGLYIIPLPEALDEDGGLNTGVPAMFVAAEDSLGRRVRFRFEGGPPQREN